MMTSRKPPRPLRASHCRWRAYALMASHPARLNPSSASASLLPLLLLSVAAPAPARLLLLGAPAGGPSIVIVTMYSSAPQACRNASTVCRKYSNRSNAMMAATFSKRKPGGSGAAAPLLLLLLLLLLPVVLLPPLSVLLLLLLLPVVLLPPVSVLLLLLLLAARSSLRLPPTRCAGWRSGVGHDGRAQCSCDPSSRAATSAVTAAKLRSVARPRRLLSPGTPPLAADMAVAGYTGKEGRGWWLGG